MKKNYIKPDLEQLMFTTLEVLTTDEEDGGGLGGEWGEASLPEGW